MRILHWLKRIFKRKQSEWVQKTLTIRYYTKKDNPTIIELENLTFKSLEPQQQFYIGSIIVEDKEV